MKTHDNKNATPSEIPAQSGQTVSDNNHSGKYKVLFHLAQRSYGTAIVEAVSFDDARRKANLLDLCDVNDWEVLEDDMSVDSVELVSEGTANE